MVISFILSTVIDLTGYTLKSVYSFGRYLVYGHEETSDEKLDRFILEFTEIRREISTLKEKQRIKDNSYNTKDVNDH